MTIKSTNKDIHVMDNIQTIPLTLVADIKDIIAL